MREDRRDTMSIKPDFVFLNSLSLSSVGSAISFEDAVDRRVFCTFFSVLPYGLFGEPIALQIKMSVLWRAVS
jgi:hypothetical protein